MLFFGFGACHLTCDSQMWNRGVSGTQARRITNGNRTPPYGGYLLRYVKWGQNWIASKQIFQGICFLGNN